MTRVVEGVLTIVKGLKRQERREFVDGLLSSGVLSEDEQDSLVINSRRRGSTRSLDQFVREMKRKGRLR
jgi:hypothetical protein